MRQPGKPPRYYVPNQIVLLVEHEAARLDEKELVRYLVENDLLVGIDSPKGTSVEDVISFPSRPAPARGVDQLLMQFLPQRYIDKRATPRSAPLARRRPHASLVLIHFFEQQTDAELEASVRMLNAKIKRPGLPPHRSLSLDSASLNWYVSTSDGPDGTGTETGGSGPACGAWPVDDTAQMLAEAHIIPAASARSASTTAFPVEVIILDTAPSQGKIAECYDKWKASNPQLHALHPVLENIQYAEAHLDFKLPDNSLSIKGYEHPQPDHGTFIASIIQSIAPQAKIQLFQVLNDHGVGNMYQIASVLHKIASGRSSDHGLLIVNCSFMVTLPKSFGNDKSAKDQEEHFWNTMSALQLACDHLLSLNAVIVAAAGNDNDDDPPEEQAIDRGAKTRQRKPAGFPAAFPRALGVGALTKDNNDLTNYSNEADTPTLSGVSTFGGEIRRCHSDKNGIVGVYLSDFPQECEKEARQNKNGLAMWAGTSFATAVVSGALANLAVTSSSAEGLIGLFAPLLNQHKLDDLGLRLLTTPAKGE